MLTNHKDRCMLHVISMHRIGDLRQIAGSDLSEVMSSPRFFDADPLLLYILNFREILF